MQSDEVVNVRLEYREPSTSSKLSRCVLEHIQTVSTVYTIKNNGTKHVPCLYVEHTARSDRGGFAITTTKDSVKQTTGWSRFCLAVEPEAEVTLTVVEEARYEEMLRMNDDDIETFLSTRATKLFQQKLLDQDTVSALKKAQAQLRLGSLLSKLLRPTGLSEENLISWEEKDWPCEPASAEKDVKQLLKQVRQLQDFEKQKQDLQRKQSVCASRVSKIFENQSRLRENIKSMEHVRTGSLLERYMSDMDKEENELIETRKRSEEADEALASMSQETSKLALQITMKSKQLQKLCSC